MANIGQMNQPTQAVLQKYGISASPNPPQVVSGGNAQVKNINTNEINNQIHNKIIVIQPQIPIAQPNIQVKDTTSENLRNWISNQFRAQQQKYQEENNFYNKYGRNLSDGIGRVMGSISDATERFAECINPSRISRAVTDSKRVILMMALAYLAAQFIGPISRRLDSVYNWFNGDGKKNPGFIKKLFNLFRTGDNSIFEGIKKGARHGFSLIKGYLKLKFEDRAKALSDFRQNDLSIIPDLEQIPGMLLKLISAAVGGTKGLSYAKSKDAGRLLKGNFLEKSFKQGSLNKKDFDVLGNVVSNFDSVQRVQKKIEYYANPEGKNVWTSLGFNINISAILVLLNAIKSAIFTCRETSGKLVRGTVISNAPDFLRRLGYFNEEIEGLAKKQYIVQITAIVISSNKDRGVNNCWAITKEGWEALAIFLGGKELTVSDKQVYENLLRRLTDLWRDFYKEKFKNDPDKLAKVEKIKGTAATSEYQEELYKAWQYADEAQEYRDLQDELFREENKDAIEYFDNLFGDDNVLEDVEEFNSSNYVESTGEFNAQVAANTIRGLSKYGFDSDHGDIRYRKDPKTSTGHCAKHVRMAIENSGIPLPDRPLEAYKYMNYLPTKGFKLIYSGRKKDLKNPNQYPHMDDLQVGDIAVFNKTRSHPSGHISMFDGQDWYSDFLQGTWHGLADKGFDSYGIFRFDKLSNNETQQAQEKVNTEEITPATSQAEEVRGRSNFAESARVLMNKFKNVSSKEDIPTKVTPEESKTTKDNASQQNTGTPKGKENITSKEAKEVTGKTSQESTQEQTSENNQKTSTKTSVYSQPGTTKTVNYQAVSYASYDWSITNNNT